MQVEDTKSYKYAESVLAGKTIASRFIRQACQRFMDDLERDDLYYDLEEIQANNDFLEKTLYIPELKKPNTVYPPHAFWIEQLHGWKWVDTELRRFSSMYLQVSRKNFKTFYAAANTLLEVMLGRDDNPDVMQGANSRDQALICTDMTAKLIKASPELNKLVDEEIELYTYKKKTTAIVYDDGERFGRIEAMPKDPGDGGNASVGVVDEFHEAVSVALLETIESGQGQRLEPMTMVITSPGHNKQGPCYTILRKKSIEILEGIIKDDSHLAIVFELDEEEEWDNIEMLEKSNPMMPYSRTLKPYLIKRIHKAHTEGGSIEVNVKIKNSGIWVDAPEVWIQDSIWKRGETEPKNNGQVFYAGLDLARKRDFSAYVLESEPDEEGFIDLFCWFWIPEENLAERERKDKNNYRNWIDEGLLFVTPGNATDFDEIERFIKQKHREFNIHSGAYDPAFATQMATHLNEEFEYMELTQTYRNLTEPIQDIEAIAGEGKFRHGNHPVLRWNCANTMIKRNPGGQMIIDKSDESKKIDGMAALLNADFQRLYSSREEKSSPEVFFV